MERGFVWELNLDAERELATAGSYTRSLEQQRFVAAHREQARAVLGASDVALGDEGLELAQLAGRVGRAWCPTPGALARLRGAGAIVPAAPLPEVLRAVNARSFCAELGQTLEGALFSEDLDLLLTRLADPAGPADWLAKRDFGVAGRGRLKLRRGVPSSAELSWLRASLRTGGVQLEPWLALEAEFDVQGLIEPEGHVHFSPPGLQLIDENGAWLSSREATSEELLPAERTALEDEGERVAAALIERGYFGPFGIDAYRYRDERGRPRLQPRSEVNARYTMGWRLRALEGAL